MATQKQINKALTLHFGKGEITIWRLADITFNIRAKRGSGALWGFNNQSDANLFNNPVTTIPFGFTGASIPSALKESNTNFGFLAAKAFITEIADGEDEDE